MIGSRKGTINGSIYNVVTLEEYRECPNFYDPKFTAIQDNGLLYPISSNPNKPGYYHKGNKLFGKFIDPSEDKREHYSVDSIIDYSSAIDIKGIIECSQSLSVIEKDILTSSDNVFVPVISDVDTPEMKALKEAIIMKNIDINQYDYRFDGNFYNDKRLLNSDRITLIKMKKFGAALDLKVTLIIEDVSPDVPNPMGEKIVVDITGGDYGDDE